MRNAVAISSEQTSLGHFGAWVDSRVRCGVLVFLHHGSDDMVNVVVLVRVRSVRVCHPETTVGNHREPFVDDQILTPYFARFRA